MKHIFHFWVLLVIVTTCIYAVVYTVVQQDFRENANDPQIQMAEDIAQTMGSQVKNFPQNTVDIAQNLTPFFMFFDANGAVVSSQAGLGGQTPTVPQGVFAYVKAHGEDRFTWQPATGVRIAAVVTTYPGGFVLAGRNLREVEKREDNLLYQVLVGWIATNIATLVAVLIFYKKK